MAYGQFLGYAKGEDGKPEVVEEEAAIIRLIYRLFIDGKTPSAIGKHLTNHGIPTPAGKEVWQNAVIRSILTQEKYAGNALLQKGFTVDFLTKTRKKNEGEIPQFFVEDSHPAIISVDEWETVQAEMVRRKSLGRPMGCKSPFSARIVCADCGGYFGRKVWGSYKGDKSRRRYIWQCNDKYDGDHRCTTPHITEDDLKSRFLAVWNGMAGNRDTLIADCRAAKTLLCDCKDINAEIKELEREVEIVTELSRKAIFENARTAQNQAEFNERNNGYIERINTARNRIDELAAEKRRRQHKAHILENYIRNLESSPQALDEFDDKVWLTSIEKAVLAEDGTIMFHFLDGSEIVG
ncbi:recombinase [Clostridia bacterium]|nr:recombinase [Clostridia bacterium]